MTLQLLGAPRLESGEGLPFTRPTLMLYYLAYKEDWASRDEVTFVFWPDEDDHAARRNLRQLVHRARMLDWAAALEVEPQRLRLRLDTDVRRFRDAIGHGRWEEASSLYRGPLLDGAPPLGLEGYEAWLESEREALHRSWREAALQHADDLHPLGRFREAAWALRRVWQSNPLDEHVLRAYLQSTYESGDRDGALAAYRTFEHHLASELGLEPMPETAVLAQAMRSGKPLSERAPRGRVRLPQHATPFIGRRGEVAAVCALLRGERRFALLTGPGGVGKTRLAVQVAAEEAERYADGVAFAPLAGVAGLGEVALALAQSLGLTLSVPQAPEAQLAAYLHNKALLLVVDGLEQFKEASALLLELVEGAPGVGVLATSREHIPLAAVAQHEVGGLSCADPEASEAAEFFLAAARRSAPHFRLPADEHPALGELCRLVSGLPLALELAAAWVGRLSLRDVCGDIVRYLEAPDGSMRATFETSWALLGADEQRVLAGLSVFQGGFGRDAAEEVADASLFALLSLVGTSLVYRAASGRYDMHELLRHYAAEKLAATPDGEEALTRHAAHFARRCATLEAELHTPQQLQALSALALERANLRAAWAQLLQDDAWDALGPLTSVLGTFYSVKGWAREGARAFTELAERARPHGERPAQKRIYGRALERRGWFLRQIGQTEAARLALDEALEVLAPDPEGQALCHISLGALHAGLGAFGPAKAHFGESVSRARTLRPHLLANALNGLGNVCRAVGEVAEAQQHYERALALAEARGNTQIAATVLCNLGVALYYLGERGEAEAATRRSHALAERLGDTPCMAICLANLAEMAFVRGDHAEASRIRRESLALRRELGDREGEAFDTVMLGYDACRQGDAAAARRWFLAGLRVAHEISALPIALDVLVGLAEVALHEGAPQVAGRYLGVVLGHPATPAEVKDRARVVAERCEGAPTSTLPPTPTSTPTPQLDALLSELLAEP